MPNTCLPANLSPTMKDQPHMQTKNTNTTKAPLPFATGLTPDEKRLLAAAPELLKALQGCLNWMEFTIPTLRGKCPSCGNRVDAGGLNWGSPLHKAKLAIANALSNQPCTCEPGVPRGHCRRCDGTGMVISYADIRGLGEVQ
jgi:hypothetical protein